MECVQRLAASVTSNRITGAGGTPQPSDRSHRLIHALLPREQISKITLHEFVRVRQWRSDVASRNHATSANSQQPTANYSCRRASTGDIRAARMDGSSVARNDTTMAKAAITARSRARVTNGIDETK